MSIITQHRDWQSLIQAVRVCAPSLLKAVPDSVAMAVLAGPCALAMWIAERTPELAHGKSLSILLVGAEATDVPDEGRWYQTLPLLLDRPFAVDVTCVGLELDMTFSSSAVTSAPAVPAVGYLTGLADYLAERIDKPIDLAIAFHPGLQKHRGWLSADGFPQLLHRGTQVVCAAYEMDEYEMERWVAEAYGYSVSKTPLANPFFLDLSERNTSIKWGRVLWSIDKAPAIGAGIDEARLSALDALNQMVMHSMAAVRESSPGYGVTIELTSSDGRTISLVHIFDNRFVDLASGEVFRLEHGAMNRLRQLPPEAVASYPRPSARDIELAVWAGAIKARYLLDTYTETTVDPSLAADMLSSLRRRAAALFRS